MTHRRMATAIADVLLDLRLQVSAESVNGTTETGPPGGADQQWNAARSSANPILGSSRRHVKLESMSVCLSVCSRLTSGRADRAEQRAHNEDARNNGEWFVGPIPVAVPNQGDIGAGQQ